MPVETPESVAAKVRELRLFQPEWEALGPRGRKEWLLKFADWMLDNADHITDVLQSETGKTRADASLEVPGIADYVSYWARNAESFLADADLDRAANGIAWGGMWNSGQVCTSVQRVYVEAPVYDEFLAKLTDTIRQLRQGQDAAGRKDGYRYDVGAMATVDQRDIVQRHVDDAVANGAKALTGGKPTGVGTFFEPTVLADVDQSMSCMQEETFGPTLPVVKVADEEEAIRLANDSAYGLSATVWTGDKERGERVARRLDVGAVNVNDALVNLFVPGIPMGGWKDSGVGHRSGGAGGMLKYCRKQAITTPRLPTQTKELLWYPVSRRRSKMALGVMRAAAARGIRGFGLKPRGRYLAQPKVTHR